MEATDQLLLSCRSQAISLFIESFLRMVQKLLESPDVSLQIFATESVLILLFFSSFGMLICNNT